MKVRDACAQRNVRVFYTVYSSATMTRNDGGCEFLLLPPSRAAASAVRYGTEPVTSHTIHSYTVQNVHAHQAHSLNLQVGYSEIT